jgi:drug/metabolite transporter (DMT)-like permease
VDSLVFWAVLAGALMHAGWNAVLKTGLDRFSSVLLLSFVQSGMALLLLPHFPLPATEAWPWIAVSIFLHTGYKLFLIRAYEHGDLSQVYPLARGAAPLIVTAVATFALGEVLSPSKLAGVLAIALGVIVMSLRGGKDLGSLPPKALGYALATAAFTAGYTLVDGMGARIAGSASSFTLWMFTGDGLLMLGFALLTRGAPALSGLRPAFPIGVLAGALSLGSYWLVVWAFTQAPIALVAALREASILFAMLIAVTFVGETAGRWRWIAAALIVGGIVLVRL